MDILNEINRVFEIEIEELNKVKKSLDKSIVKVVEVIDECKGKVILCGMGKPGHIAKKISASMCSMGIPSCVLHPSEAQHGDLGTISKEDILILISNSGETKEICNLLPNLKFFGIPMIAITSNEHSTLAQYADFNIILPKIKEAGNLGLAPTSSTTAELLIGDAISVVVSKMRGFTRENFALYHPAGSLGHKLTTKVDDVMSEKGRTPIITIGSKLTDAIVIMCNTGMGAILIIDNDGLLQGIITDGDIKRFLRGGVDINSVLVDDVMSIKPVCIKSGELAVNALRMMEDRKEEIHVIAVIDEYGRALGLIRNHDVINAGIFL